MERRLRCGMFHAALFSCGSASPAPPVLSANPIPFRSIFRKFRPKSLGGGNSFLLLPSIFTRRNRRIVQTKPIRYEKTFPSSGHRCRHFGSIRRRISGEQPLLEAERYGPCGYSHETQLRIDLVQPRRRFVSGLRVRHFGRHHGYRFEGYLYVAPRLYGQDQTAALHLGQQHSHSALRLLQLQTPRLDVGRSGLQHAVRLLDGLGQQLAGSTARAVDQSQGIQRPADRLVQTLRAPLRRRRSDDDVG